KTPPIGYAVTSRLDATGGNLPGSNFMRRILSSFALGLTLLLWADTVRAQVVFSQAPSSWDTIYPDVSHDFLEPTALHREAVTQAYDNFQLNQAATIRSVSWQGTYIDAINFNNPAAPNATAFRVSIYSNGPDDHPATQLFAQSYNPASAH